MIRRILFSISLLLINHFIFSQNVGIGESSPSKKLEVKSSVGNDGLELNMPNPSLFLIDNTSANNAWSIYNQGTDNGLAIRSSDDDISTNLNTRMFLEHATGNVGIGTISPEERLNISGNSRISGSLFIGPEFTNKGVGAIQIKKEGPNSGLTFWTESAGITTKRIWIDDATETMQLTHGSAPGNGLVINSAGSVGIGTVSPAFVLDVAGTGRFTGQVSVPTTPLAAQHAASKAYVDAQVGGVTESDPTWSGAANTTASIGRTGNIGIGTTSPVAASYGTSGTVLDIRESNNSDIAQLSVAGSGQGTGYIYVGQSDTHGGGIVYNGDDTPDLPTSTDHFSIFRRTSGVDYEVLHWVHNSNTAQFEGDISMNSNKVTNLATPTAAADGATKAYVDAQVAAVTETDPTWTGTANATGNVGRTGSVGIGVAVPTDKLDVTGNIAFTGGLKSRGSNYTSTWMVFDEHQHGNSTIIGAGGLTVVGAGESPGQIRANVAANTETLHLSADGGIQMYTNVNSGWASRVNAMEILNTGDVLIEGGDVTIGSTASTTDKYLKIISREDAALEIIADDDNSGEDDNAYIYISQDDALVDGILGFTGASNVDSRGNTYTNAINNALLLGTLQNHHFQLGANGTAQLTIEPGGDVGIGINNPSYKLHVNGRIRSNGINETSDERFKKNVQGLENALATIEKLNGVRYEWRHDEFPGYQFKKGEDLGVIAQQVEEILPEVVATDKEGYKSVQYSHIVPVLIEAVKELSAKLELKEAQHCAEIEQLENNQANIIQSNEIEMSQMKAEMNSLKTEMAQIKELIEMSAKK